MCDILKTEIITQFKNIRAESIHSDKDQNNRTYILRKFKESEIRILIATNVAARGLDVSDIKNVFNYDLPLCIEDYVHRIGRTGRNGNIGNSYSFFTDEDSHLSRDLIDVLTKVGQKVPEKLLEVKSQNNMRKNNNNRRTFYKKR